MKPASYLAGAAIVSLFAIGCGSDPSNPEPGEVDAAQAKVTTENLLTAIEAGDYAEFSRDFSPELLKALPPENFADLTQRLEKGCGSWLSVSDPVSIPLGDGYVEYEMTAAYQRENVEVWIWYTPPSQLVQGVWLDSPSLRKGEED